MAHDEASHKVQQAMNDLCLFLVDLSKPLDVPNQLNNLVHPAGFVGQCEDTWMKTTGVDADPQHVSAKGLSLVSISTNLPVGSQDCAIAYSERFYLTQRRKVNTYIQSFYIYIYI